MGWCMRDTIKSLANEIRTRWPHLEVRVERGYCNTDRQSGRVRVPGKGRYGSRLVVLLEGVVLLDHNNAETYRRTSDVRDWMERYALVKRA